MAFWNSRQELYEAVLSYPKLQEHLQECNSPEKDVHDIVDEISAEYSATVVRNVKRLFDMSFAKLYSGIKLESEEDLDINQLARDTCLVLVPNHQSYADFLSIPYLFYSLYNLPVYIASGINLNFFPMGTLFRQGGAFFIRRSFKGDTLYKLTLEAYLYQLMKTGKTLKFYFEGGRSRTGKMMPPRFGLFQMILESHSHINDGRPLCFLPVSISHEYLPEYRSHERELLGKSKKSESATQMIKILKILRRRFGTTHIRLGKPVYPAPEEETQKRMVQRLAFDCFRSVGKGMMVAPKSLLSLVLLDHVTGVQTWDSILARCKTIVNYCKDMEVPISESLLAENIEEPVRGAIDLLKKNKRIKLIKHEKLGKTLYSVPDDHRNELLYLKNSILHHFLIPLFINTAWINVFQGKISDVKDLRKFFLQQRRILRYEFYLPETNDMFEQIRTVLSKILKKENFLFSEAVDLSANEMYKVGSITGVFASAFSYIYEGHYLAALALKHHASDEKFTFDEFKETCQEIFEIEKKHGRLIRYPESFSVPLMKSTLNYFVGARVVDKIEDEYHLRETADIDNIIEEFVQILTDMLTLNIKLIKDTVG